MFLTVTGCPSWGRHGQTQGTSCGTGAAKRKQQPVVHRSCQVRYEGYPAARFKPLCSHGKTTQSLSLWKICFHTSAASSWRLCANCAKDSLWIQLAPSSLQYLGQERLTVAYIFYGTENESWGLLFLCFPQLEGHPTESKSGEERETLKSGTIGTEGFFRRWGGCWEKRPGHGEWWRMGAKTSANESEERLVGGM